MRRSFSALAQGPAVTQGQVWPPIPLCRAGSHSPAPAQLSLQLPPCTPVSRPPIKNSPGERIPLISQTSSNRKALLASAQAGSLERPPLAYTLVLFSFFYLQTTLLLPTATTGNLTKGFTMPLRVCACVQNEYHICVCTFMKVHYVYALAFILFP